MAGFKPFFLLWVTTLLVAIFSHHNVVFPVSANYYSSPADPHGQPSPSSSATPSAPATGSPPHGHHGGHSPHHGRSGSGSSGGSSSSSCTPSTPGGSGSGGSGGVTTSVPPPAAGGSGYYNTPPVTAPVTPAPPLIDLAPPTPAFTTPILPSPPISVDPGTGSGSLPPFPCTYWGSHPTLIWGVLGWLGSVGNLFGTHSLPGVSPAATVQQVLSSTRSDGFSSLYREATAAMLNSMALATHSGHRFPFTPAQIRDAFISALGSNHAAASQARLFRLANEGHLKLV